MRHFYCEERLWQRLEWLSRRAGHSVDDLVNDALGRYLRARLRETRSAETQSARSPSPSPAPRQKSPIPRSASQPRSPAPQKPPPIPRPPEPRSPRPEPKPQSLTLIFNGQRIAIAGECFVIGRVAKLCNLVIKDGNIFRRYVAIICFNGAYYLKDVGSTNGIQHRGMRIDNKRIDEGDVFQICDYELSFSYHE